MDDPPVIDTDSDQNRSEDDADKDSGQHISDCDSDPCDEDQEAAYLTSANVSTTNFSVNILKAINAGTILMCWCFYCFVRQCSGLSKLLLLKFAHVQRIELLEFFSQ